MRNYSTAPLPFMGQKRRFIKPFKNALNEFSQATTFVDLFGGSGLLSHTAKRARPEAQVIYNDYDDFHLRLLNVERTNVILEYLRSATANCPKDKKLPDKVKESIVAYLREQERTGYVDYITISSSLLFSMNYATNIDDFAKQTFYNCVRQSNYNVSGYLDGLEVVKYDYKELFDKFKGRKDVVFLIDPPYLSTEQSTYKNYWRLADYLDVLKCLKDTQYFYFTSNKSSIIELCEWLEENLEATNPFRGAKLEEQHVRINYSSSYTDMMLYKPHNTNSTITEAPAYTTTTT